MFRDFMGNISKDESSPRRRAGLACLVLTLLLALAPSASAQPARWWNDTWRYRIRVVPDAPARDEHGQGVVYCACCGKRKTVNRLYLFQHVPLTIRPYRDTGFHLMFHT